VAGKTKRGTVGSAKDRALTYVKNRVLTGEFTGGELISEGEIAAALAMSRTPVREAFLRLEAEGLLRLYPQRGALVVPVSPAEVRAVMEARLLMEKFAADKIVERGPEERAAVYERLCAEMDRQRAASATSGIHEFLVSDRTFHSITLEAAQNTILTDFYASLRDRQMRMIGASTIHDAQRINSIVDEHRAIADALHTGTIDQAHQAVDTHLASTMRSLGLLGTAT
jgi:DNA-binding GntR family transcriptional regulator